MQNIARKNNHGCDVYFLMVLWMSAAAAKLTHSLIRSKHFGPPSLASGNISFKMVSENLFAYFWLFFGNRFAVQNCN